MSDLPDGFYIRESYGWWYIEVLSSSFQSKDKAISRAWELAGKPRPTPAPSTSWRRTEQQEIDYRKELIASWFPPYFDDGEEWRQGVRRRVWMLLGEYAADPMAEKPRGES